LAGPPWTAPHYGELQPKLQPSYERKGAGMEDTGPLRAVTRGVVPLPLCSTCRLTRCRRLPCLLAGQTALTPSAKPPGKPGLHDAHLPLVSWKSHGEPGWPRRCSACGSPACDERQRQRAGTVQISSVRPRSEADTIVTTAKHMSSLRADDACFRALVPGLALNGHPAQPAAMTDDQREEPAPCGAGAGETGGGGYVDLNHGPLP
jgi:hypothetical protein